MLIRHDSHGCCPSSGCVSFENALLSPTHPPQCNGLLSPCAQHLSALANTVSGETFSLQLRMLLALLSAGRKFTQV